MTESSASTSTNRPRGAWLLRAIGLFKLVKAIVLVIGAISVVKLMHKDLGDVLLVWAHRFHIAPGNKMLERLLEKVLTVTKRQLVVTAAVLLAYATMFLIEGIGLLLLKHWAEWMTVITTAGLIPIETYEIIHRPTWLKVIAMLINIALAVYLAFHVRREAKEAKRQGQLIPT
jgi:uncharacterized membrane protein (DUF2068 family)